MIDVRSPSFRTWWIPSVFGVTVGIILFSTTYLITLKADDIWWHLKTGETILDTLRLPTENLYSFTAKGYDWLPQEWLSQVVFYLGYKWLGFKGLVFMGIVLNAMACGLVYKLTMSYSRSPYISAIITVLATMMMLSQFSLKPYLFGNLFFIVVLYVMDQTSAGGRMRPLLIFLLFMSWANFHGSFLIGLAMILIYLVASLTIYLRNRDDNEPNKVKLYLTNFILALLGSIATPNHVFGLIFPLAYMQKAFSSEVVYFTNISEWRPAGLSTPLGQMVFFYLLFCGFAVAGSGKAPKTVHLGLLVAFSVFAFSSIRNIPLLGMAATLVLARHLPVSLGRTWKMMLKKEKLYKILEKLHERLLVIDRASRALVLPILSVLVLLVMFLLPNSCFMSYSSLSGVEELSDLSREYFPKKLIHRLQDNGVRARIFNYLNWGGAMIWSLYPSNSVFIDQRSNCYPVEVFLDYFAVHHLKKGWLNVLDKWKIELVAYPISSQLVEALRNAPAWRIEYQDDQAILFARRYETQDHTL